MVSSMKIFSARESPTVRPSPASPKSETRRAVSPREPLGPFSEMEIENGASGPSGAISILVSEDSTKLASSDSLSPRTALASDWTSWIADEIEPPRSTYLCHFPSSLLATRPHSLSLSI